MISAVFFDLDETLLDDERTALEAQHLTCVWAARERAGLDPARLQSAYHAVSTGFWKTYDQAKEKRTGEELRHGFWSAGLQECGAPDSEFAAALARKYNEMRDRTYALFPDAIPCLDALNGRYTLGLITNGATSIQGAKVRALDMRRWMDVVVIAEEVGVSKPDKGIFDAALAKAGCAAGEAAMVGDLLERDILGARNAGLLPIWLNRAIPLDEDGIVDAGIARVNRASNVPPPEDVIASLEELPGLLERMPSG